MWRPNFLKKSENAENAPMTLEQANEILEKASRALPVIINSTGAFPKTVNLRTADFQSAYGSSEISSVWVFACVKAIAQTFASLNLKFYIKTIGRGSNAGRATTKSLPDNHPLVQLFWNINPVQSRYDFWEATLISLELTGEFFWALEDMIGNKPRELWVLRPDRMQVLPHVENMIAGYVYKIGGQEVPYDVDEVLFGKYHNPLDEWRGMSPLNSARQSIISEYYTVKANQNIFKQGMRISGAFVSDKALNDTAFNRLKAQLDSMYAGVDNFHRNMLLEQGLKFEKMTIPPKDMEWIKQRKLNREEILAVYKVPPVKVGIFEFANYANSEAQDKIFWTECIIPRLKKIQEYMNTDICPRYGKDIFCEFDLSKVEAFKENEKLKSEIAVNLTKNGIKTINQVRDELYNDPPVSWGDTWYAPFNLMPIDSNKNNNGSDKEGDKSYNKDINLPQSDKNDRIWYEFDKFLTTRERKFESEMKDFFDEQRKRVLDSYDENTKSFGDDRVVKLEEFNPRILARLIYDEETERLLLEKGMKKTVMGIVEQAGDRAALGLGVKFDMNDPKVLEFIANKLFKFSHSVSKTTGKQIRQSLLDGIENGESILEMRDRIRLNFSHAENVRAKRIAQTEVLGATNGASHQAYRQAGVEKKEWISARDGIVRETHQLVELSTAEDVGGTPIEQDRDFILADGDTLMYPGDPTGRAENVINCRCTIAPVVKTN